MTDRPQIRIGMCVGAFVYPHTAACLFTLAPLGTLDLVQAAFIDVAREELVVRWLEENDEPYLLFVDSDHTFKRADAEMLIDAMEWYPKIGMCGGLTVFRDGRYKPVVQWFEDDHAIPGIKLYKRTKRYIREKAIKEVDYLGTGFTIIRREVFKDLEKPYFRVYHDNNKNFWGEDVHFVKSVKAAGWKTSVHFGTNVGHIGTAIYEPHDLLELDEEIILGDRPPESLELDHAIC